MKKFTFTLLHFFISSCSTITNQIDDWPELKITIHEASLVDLNTKCWSSLPIKKKILGAVVFGCAMYDLDKKTCDIYATPNAPSFILEHEISHCKGGDHSDDSQEEVFKHWLDLHDNIREHYSKSPPKMLEDKGGHIYWDHSHKFGLIPKELFANSQEFCKQLNTSTISYKAIGYHPTAQDLNGKTYIAGGYFCVPD